MSIIDGIDFGPLSHLVGAWSGNQGTDIAPEPDGDENNPYNERIEFSVVGDVTNAEEQTLAVLFYRQIVRRESNNAVFHDQTGYCMWDATRKTVMHGFTIPRGVAVLAGGQFNGDADAENLVLELSADSESPEFGIVQSPFMRDKAKTTAFSQKLVLQGNTLDYSQTTTLDIYGKVFAHTDENRLVKI